MEQNCETCRYFAEVMDQPLGKGEGYCRRYPPQAITVGENGWATVFTPVKETGWCGEWKRHPRLGIPAMMHEMDDRGVN